MKKPNNQFRIPLQKLGWWADFRIQRRLKKAAAPASAFNLNRFMAPGYAFATLGAAVVTLGLFSQTWAPEYLASTESTEKSEMAALTENLETAEQTNFRVAEVENQAPANLAAGSALMAEPMMARSKMMDDSLFPKTGEVPLALDSYMIEETDFMADEAQDVFALGLQEIFVARLGYGGGFHYGATFKFTGANNTMAVLEGNHQDYDRLVQDVLAYGKAEFDLELEPDVLEEYLTGELPERE